ncbi:hypothetical protein GCM10009624_28390 [Gordonia sinesedis]
MGHPNASARAAGSPPDGGSPPESSALADYQGALLPGRYPPLGYAPDGTARYTPGPQQIPAHAGASHVGGGPPQPGPGGGPYGAPGGPYGAPGGTHLPPQAADGSTYPGGTTHPSDPTGRAPASGPRVPGVPTTAITLALVGLVIVVAIVAGVALLRGGQSPRADSPQTIEYVPDTQYQPPTIAPGPDEPGTEPGGETPGNGQPVPGSPGAAQVGKTASYEVTIDGTATILYVDDQGLRSEFAPPANWRVSFVATYNPLRVMVIAGGRSSVTCTIKLDGQTVASDRVTSDSSRRTATCRA